MNETTGEKFTVGLRLPGLRLQVFEVLITIVIITTDQGHVD